MYGIVLLSKVHSIGGPSLQRQSEADRGRQRQSEKMESSKRSVESPKNLETVVNEKGLRSCPAHALLLLLMKEG